MDIARGDSIITDTAARQPFVPGRGQGIEHLAAWIGTHCGVSRSAGEPAPAWLGDALSASRTVVLLLLDGVGVRQLADHAPAGALARARAMVLRSVFPSSTAPAITSMASGLPPHQHAVPGWFAWHPTIGRVIRTLPSDGRGDARLAIEPATLWDWQPLTAGMASAWAIQPGFIVDSAYSRYAYRGARRIGYRNLEEFHDRIVEAVAAASEPRTFVYAYAPHFDTAAHAHGCRSPQAARVLRALDACFARLADSLAGQDALLLATADHGFVDIAPERQLSLADEPALARMLARPLTGEPRAAFAEPVAGARDAFVAMATERLGHACTVHGTDELLAAGWFGQGEAHPRFLAHAGSVAIVAREGWSLVDAVPGEKPPALIGMHGGISIDEMRVPVAAVYRGRALPVRGA